MTSLEQHLAAHREVGVDPDNNWSTVCICGTVIADEYADVDVDALHNAHVAAAWHEARTVHTVEAAAALPVGTIVKDANGRFLRGNDGPDTSHLLDLPAFIVWTPEDGAL